MENATVSPLLVLPVALSAVWVLWDVFYASYLLGFLVKVLVNLFLKDSGVHIGWWSCMVNELIEALCV